MDGLDPLPSLGRYADKPASHDDAGRRALEAERAFTLAALQVWRARGWTLPSEATRHAHIKTTRRESETALQVRAAGS